LASLLRKRRSWPQPASSTVLSRFRDASGSGLWVAPGASRCGWVQAEAPKHLPPGGIYLDMQAEGDVVRLPVAQEGPLDFATFFADEHRELFRLLCFVTGNRADAGPDAGRVPEAVGAVGPGRADRRSQGVPVPRGTQRVPEADAHRASAARRLVPIASSYDPFDEVDLREDVRQILLGLSPRQRAALALLDLYGYDSQEAARIMGIRPSTVRALATQGRAVLRQGGPNA
jgi:predicted DNA-binding protein (UPF0251 family)